MTSSLIACTRCVLFDAVGTVIYPRPPVDEVYFAAGRRHGSGLDLEQIRLRFGDAVRQHFDAAATNEARERQRWQDIVAEVFCNIAQTRHLFEELWQHFAQADHWSLFDDVPPAWQALEALGVRLAIASNFDQRLIGICQRLAPLDQAERIFQSAAIGFSKPNGRFFEAVQRELKLNPESIVMIGDSHTNDIEPALDVGWTAFRIDRTRQSEGDHVIHTLIEAVSRVNGCP